MKRSAFQGRSSKSDRSAQLEGRATLFLQEAGLSRIRAIYGQGCIAGPLGGKEPARKFEPCWRPLASNSSTRTVAAPGVRLRKRQQKKGQGAA